MCSRPASHSGKTVTPAPTRSGARQQQRACRRAPRRASNAGVRRCAPAPPLSLLPSPEHPPPQPGGDPLIRAHQVAGPRLHPPLRQRREAVRAAVLEDRPRAGVAVAPQHQRAAEQLDGRRARRVEVGNDCDRVPLRGVWGFRVLNDFEIRVVLRVQGSKGRGCKCGLHTGGQAPRLPPAAPPCAPSPPSLGPPPLDPPLLEPIDWLHGPRLGRRLGLGRRCGAAAPWRRRAGGGGR
jgi:hypothetical protein